MAINASDKVETKDNGKPSRVGRFIKYAFLIWLAGWILRASAMGSAWQALFVGLGITLLLADIILASIEGDSALKRFLSGAWKVVFIIMAFLFFRWLVGQLIGFSLLDSYQALRKVGLIGWIGGGKIPTALIFEACFLTIGLVVAKLVASKYGRVVGVPVLIVVSLIGLWTLKAEDNSKAVTEAIQAKISVQTRNAQLSTLENKVQSYSTSGKLIKDFADKNGNVIIKKGEEVTLVDTKTTPDGGDLLVEVYPTVNGRRNGSGQSYKVPYGIIDFSNPKPEPAKQEVAAAAPAPASISSTPITSTFELSAKYPTDTITVPGGNWVIISSKTGCLLYDRVDEKNNPTVLWRKIPAGQTKLFLKYPGILRLKAYHEGDAAEITV